MGGTSGGAWVELPDPRYAEEWDRFGAAFRFRPSIYPEDWPTFREPGPSATWDISHLLSAFRSWDAEATPYNLALLHALRAWVPPGEPVLALDLNHPSYDFYPHRFADPADPAGWRVPTLPDGDYYLFVTADHRLGCLGHPWEQTLCVFGAGFLDTYEALTPLGPDRIVRRRS